MIISKEIVYGIVNFQNSTTSPYNKEFASLLKNHKHFEL